MGNLLHAERFAGVNSTLATITKEAVKNLPFDVTVSEGLRTKETQAQYVAQGKSQTMNSKHLTGQAVDLYPIVGGAIDNSKFGELSVAMKKQASAQSISIKWGGDWKTFIDKPHFEV